jgi:glycosyltransferase involved in cell wall biosynthesis
VYPPVDTQKFHTNQKKTKTIYYVGRFSNLTQLKGQSILIEAFKAISPQLPGWNLVLAGGFGVGSDQTLLNAMQVASRGYPITFMLNPDFSALKHLHATSQIFWSASGYSPSPTSLLQQEHFGISLVEAMASGSVPIVTKLGGHTEIVTHGQDGLLWTTPDELKSQTLEVINSRQLPSLSLAAIARSKMYDIASFNSNFLQLL